MKIKKILLAGVAVTVFNTIVGMVTCGGLFSWVYALEPTNVWRPMQGPPGLGFFIGSYLLSVIFAYTYVLLQKGIPGKSKIERGLTFGFCVWAVGMLPGMFATSSFMTVATTVVLYWTIMGLIQTPIQGIITAYICEE